MRNILALSIILTAITNFTFAGNIGKLQNLENIITAFCSLSNEYQEKSQLNIIGDGSNLNSLKLLANNNSNIIFHGKKPRSDMVSYYKASDFLIVSLVDKSVFSVVVPAKMQTYIAAKKPILAIINGETADIVKENNLGICVDPSNITSIREAFEKCIDMPEREKNKFVKNNIMLLERTFNKDVILKHMTDQLINHTD